MGNERPHGAEISRLRGDQPQPSYNQPTPTHMRVRAGAAEPLPDPQLTTDT